MNARHCKIIMLYGSPFDKALLSEVEGLRANGINQRLLKLLEKRCACSTLKAGLRYVHSDLYLAADPALIKQRTTRERDHAIHSFQPFYPDKKSKNIKI